MEEKYVKRFNRWQDHTIQQFGSFINLTISFNVILLSACFSFILKPNEFSFIEVCLGKFFLILAILSLGIGLVLGVFCQYNRLTDFRNTAKLIKMKSEQKSTLETNKHESYIDELGKITWQLLKCHLITLGCGSLFMMVSIFSKWL